MATHHIENVGVLADTFHLAEAEINHTWEVGIVCSSVNHRTSPVHIVPKASSDWRLFGGSGPIRLSPILTGTQFPMYKTMPRSCLDAGFSDANIWYWFKIKSLYRRPANKNRYWSRLLDGSYQWKCPSFSAMTFKPSRNFELRHSRFRKCIYVRYFSPGPLIGATITLTTCHFDRLRKQGVIVNGLKCMLGRPRKTCWRCIIFASGTATLPDKVPII